MNLQVIVVRAGKTFLQAFVASLSVGLTGVTNVNAGKALLVAAIAAGVSAVMNLFLRPSEAK